MHPWTIVGYLLVGLAAGVLSGMFGVGGAVMTTPGIRALGATPIMAVGSTIPAILPAAISGAHRYAKAKLVDWRVALTCGIAGTLLALIGAKVSDVVDARWLMVATAVLLGWSGISSIRKARAMPLDQGSPSGQAGAPSETESVHTTASRSAPAVTPGVGLAKTAERSETVEPGARTIEQVANPPGTPALVGVGAAAGFLAGLLGIGGGAIMMPLFTNVLKLPVKVAVGSSLVAVAIFSVPAMISHALLGHIDWAIALLLVAGTVPGARIGSRIAIGTEDVKMRLLLGVFFCVIAVVYGGRELLEIL